MSILIRGMEMPTNCRQCSLYLQSMDSERNAYENCAVTAKSYNWGLTTRPSDCPLIEVPAPHGDLIDRDALPVSQFVPIVGTAFKHVRLDYIENAPTVIPAEEAQ